MYVCTYDVMDVMEFIIDDETYVHVYVYKWILMDVWIMFIWYDVYTYFYMDDT